MLRTVRRQGTLGRPRRPPALTTSVSQPTIRLLPLSSSEVLVSALRLPLLVALVLAPAAAQGCPGAGTFWKRDTLPIVPSGLASVGVVAGMCEGESAGVVFEMPANMSAQRITQVVAPWGSASGIPGLTAALDLEVWDGVSFSGASVNMGTRVFSLSQNTSGSMQVATHGLNTFDTSPYNIVVGLAPPTGTPAVRRFAITFRIDINTVPDSCNGGSVPTSFTSFFTDATSQIGFGCNSTITPQRTSVIEIQGQGWRDPALAQIGIIPLCPNYYRGIFCIRACSEDAFPAYYTTFANGCPSSLPTSQLIPATLPRIGTTMFVIVNNMPVNSGVMVTGFSDTTSVFGPLPLNATPYGATGCTLFVSADVLTTLVGGGGAATFSLSIPNVNTLLGAQLFQQPAVVSPGLNPLEIALGNAAKFQVGQ